MSWENSLSTFIWVFSIGRGNACFVRSALNQGFIIDMGGGQIFDPVSFMKQHFISRLDKFGNGKIAQAILSHPHLDHIAQCEALKKDEPLSPALLTLPNDKCLDDGSSNPERLDWRRFDVTEDNEETLNCYKSLYQARNLPLQTISFEGSRTVPNLEYGIYYVKPSVCDALHPSDDNKFGNATSIVVYIRQGAHSILIPGDITPEAMDVILDDRDGVCKRYTVFNRQHALQHPRWHDTTCDQPSLGSLLMDRGLSILIAPHHGLESCFSESLYRNMQGGKPQLTIISERRIKRDSDGATDSRYQSASGASGLDVDIEGRTEFRYSLGTSLGHHILVELSGHGRPRICAHRDPEELLQRMG